MKDMNRECTFAEFMAITKAYLHQICNLNYMTTKLDFSDYFDKYTEKEVRQMMAEERE